MPTLDESLGPRPPLTTEAARKMVVRSGAIVAILVEGWSDQAALEALAHRRGLNLAAERIVTSTRDSNLRVSLHLYNVEEDVDRILASLASRRGLLA